MELALPDGMTNSAAILETESTPRAQLIESAWVDWAAFRNCLKAALVVCSEDDSRVALNSILIEVDPSKIRLVSTDGHRCMTISLALPCSTPTENRDTFHFQISRDDAMAWVKSAPPKKATIAELKLNERELTIETASGIAKMRTVDAQFPPYDQVIPKLNLTQGKDNKKQKRAVSLAVGINGKYLGDLGTISKLVAHPRTKGVATEVGTNELDPIRFDMSNSEQGIETVYVVMPMRM